MSPSAVTERVTRMEESGVISGCSAVVSPEALGLDILAFVRLRYPTGNYKPFHDLLDTTPEIVEAHHMTGEDCFVLKVSWPVLDEAHSDVAHSNGALGGSSPLTARPSASPRGLGGVPRGGTSSAITPTAAVARNAARSPNVSATAPSVAGPAMVPAAKKVTVALNPVAGRFGKT